MILNAFMAPINRFQTFSLSPPFRNTTGLHLSSRTIGGWGEDPEIILPGSIRTTCCAVMHMDFESGV